MNQASHPPFRHAFTADRIFDGDDVLYDHAVVVEGESISEIAKPADLPPNVQQHRYPGCTLIPGLIDTHIHFMRWQGPVFLSYGVTSVRDTGNDLQWILRCREEWPRQAFPRILCMGPLLDGTPPVHPQVARAITDTDGAIAAVRETAAAGVDGIKLYASIAAEWIEPMVAASHELGLKVSMHCLPHGVLIAGRAGVDEFFHLDGILADIWPDHPPGWLHIWGDPGLEGTWDRQRQVADLIAEMRLTSTPTLAYWDSQRRMRLGDGPWPEERQLMPADLFKWSSATPDAALGARWHGAMAAALKFQALLTERGVPVLAGSDTPCGGILPGQSLWRELSLLVEVGLSPVAVLQAATRAAADFLQRPELGRLRSGCAADMVAVRGDITDCIPLQPEISHVMRAGVSYQAGALLTDEEDPSWRDDPWGRQFEQYWNRLGERR